MKKNLKLPRETGESEMVASDESRWIAKQHLKNLY